MRTMRRVDPELERDLVDSASGQGGLGLMTVVGLFVAIVLPLVQPQRVLLRAADAFQLLVKTSRFSAAGAVLACSYLLDAAVLILLVRCYEEERWDSIGVRRLTPSDFLCALGTSMTAFIITSLRFHLSANGPAHHTYQRAILDLPRPLRFTIFAADSLVEELGSHAYIIERLVSLTGNLWLAGLLSGGASLLMHCYVWGFRGAVDRACGVLLLVGLYLWRRSLVASVLAHFLIDAELSLVLMLPRQVMPWVAFALGLGKRQ